MSTGPSRRAAAPTQPIQSVRQMCWRMWVIRRQSEPRVAVERDTTWRTGTSNEQAWSPLPCAGAGLLMEEILRIVVVAALALLDAMWKAISFLRTRASGKVSVWCRATWLCFGGDSKCDLGVAH